MAEVARFARTGTPSASWPPFTPSRECIRRFITTNKNDKDGTDDKDDNVNTDDKDDNDDKDVTDDNGDDGEGSHDATASCGDVAAKSTMNLNERCRYIIDHLFHGILLHDTRNPTERNLTQRNLTERNPTERIPSERIPTDLPAESSASRQSPVANRATNPAAFVFFGFIFFSFLIMLSSSTP